MGIEDILEFVRVEHTLFSLPFVLIGYVLADNEFGTESMDLVWIIVAAIGARGLAMALNRIVDRDIDAENPRTAARHLPSGTMSVQTAWILAGAFLGVLLFAAWRLNEVALKMAWLPVLAFVIYPYTKRVSWICHFWIGMCLALAPAGAWVAIAADTHGWASITGMLDGQTAFLWFPEVFFISLGVALWIAAFDINYALMDEDVDREQGIRSFPAIHGHVATMRLSVALTIGWLACFLLTGLHDFTGTRSFRSTLWVPSVVLMALVNIFVMTKGAQSATESDEEMGGYQKALFRASMLTGWVLLSSLMIVEHYNDGMSD
ncbi:MAG: 4-hydroxybenzoate octaprenyltransferase [Candidatus Thalassarchaeaceae archaeon]|jgi:4-hydroxybenzoate polyprenyltransferase|nr:4-hydroxybenzoate octaprenyltransferase [Candidatus Thalassarchaeaceae archaeon]MDP7003573.1 4-hydroxybenzoate octaprenyltransferase [Candidatus Thalassarchaeaceae archaeon]